jgi:hypothetical protein
VGCGQELCKGEWGSVPQKGSLSNDDYLQEANLPGTASPSLEDFHKLHLILGDIRSGSLSSAIAWASREADFLDARSSQLEFALHRSRFLRIALGKERMNAESDDEENNEADGDRFMEAREHNDQLIDVDGEDMDEDDQLQQDRGSDRIVAGKALDADGDVQELSNTEEALLYGRHHFRPTQAAHLDEIKRLFTFLLFLPDSRTSADELQNAKTLLYRIPKPYHCFLDEDLMHSSALAPLFQRDFTARQGVAREAPLKVAVEVGAGGALNIIIKVRSLMKEKGNEWSQADELPVSVIFMSKEKKSRLII